MSKPKVFVTQEQPHINYEKAETYGEVTFVSVYDVPTVKGSRLRTSTLKEIVDTMVIYRSGIDYILPSGSPLNIAAVMLVAGRVGDKHNILKWDRQANTYTRAELELPR